MSEQIILRYLQLWGKDYLRHRLDWIRSNDDRTNPSPRHLSKAYCCCQYVEELLLIKESTRQENSASCCASIARRMESVGFKCC